MCGAAEVHPHSKSKITKGHHQRSSHFLDGGGVPLASGASPAVVYPALESSRERASALCLSGVYGASTSEHGLMGSMEEMRTAAAIHSSCGPITE